MGSTWNGEAGEWDRLGEHRYNSLSQPEACPVSTCGPSIAEVDSASTRGWSKPCGSEKTEMACYTFLDFVIPSAESPAWLSPLREGTYLATRAPIVRRNPSGPTSLLLLGVAAPNPNFLAHKEYSHTPQGYSAGPHWIRFRNKFQTRQPPRKCAVDRFSKAVPGPLLGFVLRGLHRIAGDGVGDDDRVTNASRHRDSLVALWLWRLCGHSTNAILLRGSLF